MDDKTGKPVTSFRIIPGYQPPIAARPTIPKPLLQQVPWNERPYWMYGQEETFTNGAFSVDFVPLSSQPIIEIQAQGYEPLETDPTNTSVTNLVFRLKPGAGPNGIVLMPDGTPATGASVIYGANQEQFSLDGTKLNAYGRVDSHVVTSNDGKFSFLGRSEGTTLFVAHPSGWAQLPVAQGGGDNVKIRLKPWAALTGTLVDTNGVAMAGTSLALTMFHDWQHGGAMVNLQSRVTTDKQGHFTFTNVPPSRVEVQRLIPMGGGGWTYQPQTWVVPTPGITNDLGNVTFDHPPPEPVMDQLKQRFGL